MQFEWDKTYAKNKTKKTPSAVRVVCLQKKGGGEAELWASRSSFIPYPVRPS